MDKKILKEYFRFSKRERIGIAALLLLLLFIAFFPALVKKSIPAASMEVSDAYHRELQKLERAKTSLKPADEAIEESNKDQGTRAAESQLKLFHFDPNTLEPGDWKKLGVKDKTIQTIQKYLSKGGQFRKAEDIRKIFGLSEKQKEQLIPFVRIAGPALNNRLASGEPKKQFESRPEKVLQLEINSADSADWVALPGIGEKLAGRIISFRNKLGGFYNLNQVSETFGLPDSTFQKIKPSLLCDELHLRKININTADVELMKQHPYIKWKLANAISQYRQLHGKFLQAEEIIRLGAMEEAQFAKLLPYLSVE